MASNGAEVKDIVKEIRGDRTSSSTSVRIYISDDGRLSCRRGDNGKFRGFGFLEITEDDEVIQKAIQRILNSSGVIVK